MIDKTLIESQALESTLHWLAEIANQVGWEKALSEYTREEALMLVESVVDAYQSYMLKNSEILEKKKVIYACYH